MEVEISGQGGDRWSRWRSVIHGSWIMGLDGDGDGDGWVWSERLGFSGFQWGWAVAVEIGVAVKVGVGLGFVFTGLVGGGVFQGFCSGGWSVVEVEIGVAIEIVWPCLCFGD